MALVKGSFMDCKHGAGFDSECDQCDMEGARGPDVQISALRARVGELEAELDKQVSESMRQHALRREAESALAEEQIAAATELGRARQERDEMHRRAQKLEGIELHMETLRRKHEAEKLLIRKNAGRRIVMLRKRYRTEVDRLIALGVPSEHPGMPGRQTGYLNILIDRVVEAARQLRGALGRVLPNADPLPKQEDFDAYESTAWLDSQNRPPTSDT